MMRVASSLTNRIFLASTLLAVLALGFTLYFVNARVSAAAEAELRRSVTEAATLVERRRQDLTDTFTTLARSIADLPTLKGVVDTGDPPTVQPSADEYRLRMNVDLLLVTGRDGVVLGKSGAEATSLTAVKIAPDSPDEVFALATHARGLLQVISVPIQINTGVPDLLGRLSVGFFMDDAVATRLRELTGSEVAFAAGGQVLASSLPAAARSGLQQFAASTGAFNVQLGSDEYLALTRPMLGGRRAAAGEANQPMTLVLGSRTERLRVLRTLQAGLGGILVVTVLLATVLSYLVARTMTRPLAAVTSAKNWKVWRALLPTLSTCTVNWLLLPGAMVAGGVTVTKAGTS